MITTLEILCNELNWQGGTIHDALREFKKMDMKQKDKICNSLMRAIDNKLLTDIEQAKNFFNARIGKVQ